MDKRSNYVFRAVNRSGDELREYFNMCRDLFGMKILEPEKKTMWVSKKKLNEMIDAAVDEKMSSHYLAVTRAQDATTPEPEKRFIRSCAVTVEGVQNAIKTLDEYNLHMARKKEIMAASDDWRPAFRYEKGGLTLSELVCAIADAIGLEYEPETNTPARAFLPKKRTK